MKMCFAYLSTTQPRKEFFMNICVFGSSSEKINKVYLDSAYSLGKAIAQKGHTMIYGAGKYGVMGAAARGVVSQGGKLIGVTPRFFDDLDVLYENDSETIYTETMRERKGIMEDKSDAFIVCAGGMGTFEEFFEVLTLKQLRRHEKPIIIYNVNGYYDNMIKMMNFAVEERFMSDECNLLYTLAETEDEIFDQLKNYVPYTYSKYNYLDWSKDDKNG